MTEQEPSSYIPPDPYHVRNRERQRKEQLVEYLGELLLPQTEGFDHINLDMTFTDLNIFELSEVTRLCMDINICHIFGFKQSEYLLRGELAAFVNSRRSKNARSMELFTQVTTKQEQVFEDKTQEKKGFNWFFGKKKTGGAT